MNRFTQMVALIIGPTALALLAAFWLAERPPSPYFDDFYPNAYRGVGEFAGMIELDNRMVWWDPNNPAGKRLTYYAFRVTVASETPSDHLLYLSRGDVEPDQRDPLPIIDGPCPPGRSPGEERLMASESRKHTGDEKGAAVYSAELGSHLIREHIPAVYWKSCEGSFPQEDFNDKGHELRTYSVLVSTDALPGTLAVRTPHPWWGILRTSAATSIPLRVAPIHLAAVGDSLVWGQGLRDEEKYPVRLAELIETQLRVQVQTPLVRAHSGAVLGPAHDCEDQEALDGEVLTHEPTINCQFSSISQPERVDVIIANGCINNVGPLGIATGLREGGGSLEPIDVERLRGLTAEHCEDDMSGLLMEMRKSAPNATIVVLGYYPLLAMGSIASCAMQELVFAGTALSASVGGALAVLTPLVILGPAALPMLPLTWQVGAGSGASAGFVVSEVGLAAFLAEAENRSRVWVEASNAALSHAVMKVRHTDDLRGRGVGNVVFVPVSAGFFGHEAFTLVEPRLFGIDCAWKSDDPREIRERREELCPALYSDDLVTQAACVRAAAFHPNEDGAKTIFNRIRSALVSERFFIPMDP